MASVGGSRGSRGLDDGEGEEMEGLEQPTGPSQSQSKRDSLLAAFHGTGADLATSVQTTSLDSLRNSLSTLRGLTGLSSYNERPSPSDRRTQLATEFCRAGGVAPTQLVQKGILDTWDLLDSQNNLTLLPDLLFSLSNIISLLGAHQPTHELGDAVVQKILPVKGSPDESSGQPLSMSVYWTRLQTYLSNTSGKGDVSAKGKGHHGKGATEVVLMAALRLLLEMSTFAGGKYARAVFDNMNWTMKALPRLASMRRKSHDKKKGSKAEGKAKVAVTLDRPDIRTLWILFLLSFLRSKTGSVQPTSLQIALLSLGRDFLPSILKGLAKDPPQIVVHTLTALHDGLLSDEAATKLPRSKVVGFFNEWACKLLLDLYERESDSIGATRSEEGNSVADVIHHFMLRLCTHPGQGVCYIDEGWYGRRQVTTYGDEDDEEGRGVLGEEQSDGVYNKVLLGVLKSLSPTRSPKQAELTLRILTSSQELIGPYLHSTTGSFSSSSLEPKGLSIAWLSTVAFLGRALHIPIPPPSEWKQSPPTLDRCIHSLIPATISRALLTRGIHHKDRLTRHGALTLLSRLLARLYQFSMLCDHLHELHHVAKQGKRWQKRKVDEEMVLRGVHVPSAVEALPWLDLKREVIKVAKLRLPDLTAVLAAIDPVTQKEGGGEGGGAEETKGDQSLMMKEAALRTAGLHHKVFEAVSAADVGKLLSTAALVAPQGGKEERDGRNRLKAICQLHALQLLASSYRRRGSMSLDLFSKQSAKGPTHFSDLLRLAVSPVQNLVREKSRELIKNFINYTILFEHLGQEWDIWQFALDKSSEEELDFFEESAQRCLKTPYRYIEASRRTASDENQLLCASPLLSTMMEQYLIRLRTGLLAEKQIKVSFLHFLARLLPCLATRHVGPTLIPKLFEPFERQCREAADEGGKEARDAVLFALDVVQTRLLAMMDGPAVVAEALKKDIIGLHFLDGQQILAGIRDSSLVLDNLHPAHENVVEAVRGSKIALPPTLVAIHSTTTRVQERVAIDWDSLLDCPVQTTAMMAYCRNALVRQSMALDDVLALLKATFQSGNVGQAALHEMLVDCELEEVCKQQRGALNVVMESLTVAPLTNVRHAVAKVLAIAVKTYYESGSEQTTRREKEMLMGMYDFLYDEEKRRVMERETLVDLHYEQLSASTAWKGCPAIIDRFVRSVLPSRDVSVLQKTLSVLIHALSPQADMQHSLLMVTNSADRDSLLHFLLFHPGRAQADGLFANLLNLSSELKRAFWHQVLHYDDRKAVLFDLPGTFCSLVQDYCCHSTTDGAEDSPPELLKGLLKECLAHAFDGNQTRAALLTTAASTLQTHQSIPAEEVAVMLASVVPERPGDAFKASALVLVAELVKAQGQDIGTAARSVRQDLLDKALLWLVRRFAEDGEESEETVKGIEALLLLLQTCKKASFDPLLKAHLAEPVLTAAISNRLASKLHVELIRSIVSLCPLRHSVCDQVLLDVIESREVGVETESSEQAVAMAFEAVRTDVSLCKPHLIAALVSQYGGTLSRTDRKILETFRIYELKRNASVSSFLDRWKRGSTSDVNLGTLSHMDPNRVFETCVKFPRGRSFEDLRASGYESSIDEPGLQASVYDPLHVLAVLGGRLDRRQRPLTSLQWLEVVRTNTLGVVVCCLSSKSTSTRSSALNLLSLVYSRVRSSQFQERDNLLLILDSVRNSYSNNEVADLATPAPLPLTTTLFVAHALRSLASPSLYLYPLISRFLLQRPMPDPTDVPLLYNFLYSSSTQSATYKSERIHILRFLHACIKFGGKVEWNILKRRHVWDSLCTLYTIPGIETGAKRAMEDIFEATTRKPQFASRIVHRHHFFNYLSQLIPLFPLLAGDDEIRLYHVWMRCLTNAARAIDIPDADPFIAQSASNCLSKLIGLFHAHPLSAASSAQFQLEVDKARKMIL